MRSSGRGKLPVWVVKKRSVLRIIVASTQPGLAHARDTTLAPGERGARA
jgi:hypothetical protein